MQKLSSLRFIALMLLFAPLFAFGQVYLPLTGGTLSGNLIAPSVNGKLNPASCGNATPPSWCSGSDIGAWINAAYAQLPSNGGEIDVPSGPYTLTNSIVFGALYKPALLRCSPGTIITYSATNGNAITLDWGWNPNGMTKYKLLKVESRGANFSETGDHPLV